MCQMLFHEKDGDYMIPEEYEDETAYRKIPRESTYSPRPRNY